MAVCRSQLRLDRRRPDNYVCDFNTGLLSPGNNNSVLGGLNGLTDCSLQDSWDDILWAGVDSGMGAGPTDQGFLGRVQYRSESALAYFLPVQLFCAGLLVPVYLAVLVRCFIIADAEIPQPAVNKPVRKRLPDPDDPALVVTFSFGKGGGRATERPTIREALKNVLGSVYFTMVSVVLVVVSAFQIARPYRLLLC